MNTLMGISYLLCVCLDGPWQHEGWVDVVFAVHVICLFRELVFTLQSLVWIRVDVHKICMLCIHQGFIVCNDFDVGPSKCRSIESLYPNEKTLNAANMQAASF